VRVELSEQVQGHAAPRPPQPAEWGGRLLPALGRGGPGDADGD
jgi:hypothetical protein